MSRIEREKVTVEAMIRLYCKACHKTDTLCGECSQLLEYAHKRLSVCQFREKKPVCGKCKVHCYEPAMRERIRQVMRFSGPRMIFRHPLLALFHLADKVR